MNIVRTAEPLYRDTFAKNIHELGCTDVPKMDIAVADGTDSVNAR